MFVPPQDANYFAAQDDKGNVYTIIEYEEHRSFVDLQGHRTDFKTEVSWQLDDGRSVTRVNPETFKIVETDVVIRKLV
jgi:hypothetical protein